MGKFNSIFLVIIFLTSCEENNCLNYVRNDDYFKLGLRVDSIDNNNDCIYYTNILSCVENNEFTFKGKMFAKDSIFFYKILAPESEYFPLFDLTKRKRYSINIKLKDSTNIIFDKELIVDFKQRIKSKGKEVFIFNVENISCYQNYYYDGVYFLTLKNGIIGSYLYKNIDGVDYYAYPEGDILKEQINYSKFKRFQLL